MTIIIKNFDNSSNYSKRAFNKYYPNNANAFSSNGNIDISKLQNKFKLVKNKGAKEIAKVGRVYLNKKKEENLEKLDEYKKYFKNDTFPKSIGNIFIKTNTSVKTEINFQLEDFIKKIEEGKTSSITNPLSLSEFTNQIIQNLNYKLLTFSIDKVTGIDEIDITLNFNNKQTNIKLKKDTLNDQILYVRNLYSEFNYDNNSEQEKLVNFKR